MVIHMIYGKPVDNRGNIWVGNDSVHFTTRPANVAANHSPDAVLRSNKSPVQVTERRDGWIETVMASVIQQAIDCYGVKKLIRAGIVATPASAEVS